MKSQKKTTNIKESLRSRIAPGIETQTPVEIDKAAVSEGRKPPSNRRRDAAALQTRASELYGVPAGGLPPIPYIESRFKFTPSELDSEFLYLHVEPLLEQASALLERCAATRSRRDALQVEKWKMQLELDRFSRSSAIQRREREAGLDTVDYECASLEAAAHAGLEENYRNSEIQIKGLMDDLLASGFNRRMSAREVTAWLAGYPLKDSDLGGDEASYVFDGVAKSKPDHLFDAARIEVDEAAWEQVFLLTARRYAAMAESEAGRLRKESLIARANWYRSQIAFRSERAQLADDEMDEKLSQIQSPAGLLNYNERIGHLERVFSSEFRDAMARLNAACRGLKEVYGYAVPFPDEGATGYFDEVCLWTGTAERFVKSRAQLDQNYVLAVSIRELTKSQWEPGRSSSEWSFEIPESMFPGQAHVRMRGLELAFAAPRPEEPESGKSESGKSKSGAKSASIAEAVKPEGFLTARVSLPPVATVRHASGAAIELDQKALPVCFFGRVTDRNTLREPEITGFKALHNASPVGGPWKVVIAPASGAPSPARFEDLYLFLHVAAASRKG